MTTIQTTNINNWELYADKAIAGELLTLEEALSILQADNDEVLKIMDAAFKVRKHYYGKKVKLNMIINAKSGLCPEDCGYCSQSIASTAPVEKYSLLNKETLIAGAKEAINRKAGTYCIVASGRGPTDNELEEVFEAVKEITETTSLKVCACLGILSPDKAKKLKEAGYKVGLVKVPEMVSRSNHFLIAIRPNISPTIESIIDAHNLIHI